MISPKVAHDLDGRLALLQAAMANAERTMQRNMSECLYADYEFGAIAHKPSLYSKILTKSRVKLGNFISGIADKIRGYSLDDY